MRLNIIGFVILTMTSLAHATFSVVAVDNQAGYQGGALASCTAQYNNFYKKSLDNIIYFSDPQGGVVHAQSLPGGKGEVAIELLKKGHTAPQVVEIFRYTNSQDADPKDPRYHKDALDRLLQNRQFGLVDRKGNAAGLTGNSDAPIVGTPQARADAQGTEGRFTFSVQGNTLTSTDLIKNMESNFREGQNCKDIVDRMMKSLEASSSSLGDFRCAKEQKLINGQQKSTSADSGYLIVEDSNGKVIVRFDYTCNSSNYLTQNCQDAVQQLKKQYLTWRKENRCLN